MMKEQLLKMVEQVKQGNLLDAEEQKRVESARKDLEKVEKEIAALQEKLSKLRERKGELENVTRTEEKKKQKNVKLIAELAKNIGMNPASLGLPESSAGNGKKSNTKNLVFYAGKRKEKYNTASRMLWYHSRGCGGSNEDGRLSVGEFMSLVEKSGKKYSAGDWEITLPNGVKVSAEFQKN